MSAVLRYAGVSFALLLGCTLILWPWLDAGGRAGVLGAALLAYPIQVVAFGLLIRFQKETNRFLAVWAGGTVVRMLVVGIAAFVLIRYPSISPVSTLLALAGFFFGLLLLEPLFFGAKVGGTVRKT
jgi:hypothetical protein